MPCLPARCTSTHGRVTVRDDEGDDCGAVRSPAVDPTVERHLRTTPATAQGRFDNGRGTVVFDLNDFDESFVANYLYDVYRMAASIVLVARNNSMPDSDVSAAACLVPGSMVRCLVGCLPAAGARAVPRMFLTDTLRGSILRDVHEITENIAAALCLCSSC